MFTDKELDKLDRRFKMALDDKFDAYNETINALRADNEKLRTVLQEIERRTCNCSCDNIARDGLENQS